MATLMITGAAGRIGTALRAGLTDHELRLTDIADLSVPAAANETFVRASLAEEDVLTQLAEGADLIVHLGGVLTDRDFIETTEANIVGSYHALEAARRAGVRRFFFAGSNHAVGYTPIAEIEPGTPVARMEIRPDSFYGVAKVAAEGLCSLYADQYDMIIVSARILTFAPAPRSLRELATWISPADTVRLVLAALALDRPGHHVCWGVSRNTRGWADLSDGLAIGFDPQDDAERYAEPIVAAATPEDQARLAAVGGRTAPRLTAGTKGEQ